MFNQQYMQLALQQAEIAFAKEEVPVGAVIINIHTKEIIALSHNLTEQNNSPIAHAEILAIEQACQKIQSKNLGDYEIYISLEPCAMCAAALANSRIKRIYYATPDEKGGAIEHNIKFFQSNNAFHQPEIYTGIMAEESKKLLKSFFLSKR